MDVRNRFSTNKDAYEAPKPISNNLKVYICTWNVATIQPKFDFDDLLQASSLPDSSLPDIYAIGLQEVNSKPLQYLLDLVTLDPWSNALSAYLSRYGFLRFKTVRLVGIVLNIFLRKSLIPFVKFSCVDWIRLGFCGLWGNKGANYCKLSIGNTDICFVNSHLTAHEHNDHKRIEDCRRIIDKRCENVSISGAVLDNDYVFFFGDLNFRLKNLSVETIKQKINEKSFDDLLKHDQYNLTADNYDHFFNFKESKINFAPTYKFDKDTDNYDTSKKRRKPAWCDRILHQIKDTKLNVLNIETLNYDSLLSFKQSDHKPVYGIFQIKASSWNTMKPLVKVVKVIKNKKFDQYDITYQVNSRMVTSYKDWIGLYRPDFKHANDYMAYAWAAKISHLENASKERVLEYLNYSGDADENDVVISRTVAIASEYLDSGSFQFGYNSSVFVQLVALSEPMEISQMNAD